MFHLTARVAWHDSRWNGRVCRTPSCNSFCTALDRIREERDDVLLGNDSYGLRASQSATRVTGRIRRRARRRHRRRW